MTRISLPVVSAQDYRGAVEGELWELRPAAVAGAFAGRSQPRDNSPAAIAQLAAAMLQTPVDFPTIEEAIVPGDHVTLAVDPNVPRVTEVLRGVIALLSRIGAGKVSVVLWSETGDELLQRLQTELASSELAGEGLKPLHIEVVRHQSRRREDLRYIVADENAEAVYLAKDLVDADFTVPILAARSRDAIANIDPTGVFPMFADAATQHRYQSGMTTQPSEAAWLLGVQLMVLVSADAAGDLGRLVAGTPDALRHELTNLYASGETNDQELWDRDQDADDSPSSANISETVPTADLVVAALDGDAACQTWTNLARAAIAAGRHVTSGGTIVLWSRVASAPGPVWTRELGQPAGLIEHDEMSEHGSEQDEDDHTESPATGLFQEWDNDTPLARQWSQLIADGHVLLHSDVDDSVVESLGMGVIHSVNELRTLGSQLHGAGVLRAAHFQTESIVQLTTHVTEDE